MKYLKHILKERGQLLGTVLSELYSPNIPILFQGCGFDYFILDCEHGCFDYGMVATLTTVSKNVGIPMIVRVPGYSREYILKYMDMGVDGLLVPMVSSPDEISRVVEYAKYKPLGNRGITTMRAHNNYLSNDIAAYMQQANDNTLVLAQIETVRSLENIESIASTSGLDGLVVGPNDLTSDMGIPGQYGHAKFTDAVKLVHRVAAERGKITGMIISRTEVLRNCKSEGMELLCWSSELGMIARGSREGLQEIMA
ncbi:MAG TPA: hypothetical protein DCY35_07170 [Prolixibacteraceae bacterium]|nr:hypothetical protein [Prolixibacteraceae bacterium]